MRPYVSAVVTIIVTVIWAGLGAFPAIGQTNYDTSPNGQTGVQVFGSYFAANIDTIGVYNGNLMVSIPLFSLPGRELPYGLTLTYNGQKWESDSIYFDTVGRYTGGWVKSNLFGKAPSFFAELAACEYIGDYYYDVIYNMNVYWIDGAGTKHKYTYPLSYQTTTCDPPGPNGWDNLTLSSMDSDGSTFWTGQHQTDGADAARINFKNGHILYFRTSNSTVAYDYVTPNGNYLINSANESGLPAQDTLS